MSVSRISLFALAAMCAGACAAEREVAVVVQHGEGPTPAGIAVSAFPFDPDRLLDSLARAAPRPQPRFPDLQRVLLDFRRPAGDTASAAPPPSPLRALRDSVARLSDSLTHMDRQRPEYAALYERFRQLYTRFAQRAAESRDAATGDLASDDRLLARRARAAAESLRAWEEQAYADVDRLTIEALQRTGRNAEEAVTDSSGIARLALPPGPWWIVARRPDPANPFVEHAWTVPVHVTRLFPLRVPLLPRTARREWRH